MPPPSPDTLPSRIVARAEEPFEQFDEADLRLIGTWLEQSAAHWPTRRGMRAEPHHAGKRIDLRATLRRSRTTGWEPVELARTRPRRPRRRLVLVCDVSRSMQPYAAIYLHLMRATAFAAEWFSAGGIRLLDRADLVDTGAGAPLARGGPARANAKVVDRYGGTHLGRSIHELLAPRMAAHCVGRWRWSPRRLGQRPARGARQRPGPAQNVVRRIWSGSIRGPPRRDSNRWPVRWRSLPYCDVFLPAHSLAGLRDLFDALGRL